MLWLGEEARQINDTHYTAEMPPPARGWRAFFIEVLFDAPAGVIPNVFTTQVNVVPNNYPFPACYGDGCKGKLL